jgi:D-alanyl-D-alanine carboxypeptidase
MALVRSGAQYGLRFGVLALSAATAVVAFTSEADAWHHHHGRAHYVHTAHRSAHVSHRHAHAEEYSPPSASIVMDGNSGNVLQAANPDSLRHPASLTKIMTLYLLFERLDAGKIKLDTPLRVTDHASDQAPTKLGLRPGQTIMVEDAIKGVVTRSANDAAVVIAENLGGDEDGFAKLMTQKAHALGMSHTTYVNASGLPDDDQVTTARDQALLGRAIQERFPRLYKYFSTTSFVFHGETIRGHNHLLGSVEGVDGIKTGFTRASGFNLVTSVHRDGRFIVAVVLGGRSSFERDSHMRELIVSHIREASLQHSVAAIAERTDDAQPVAFAKAPISTRADPAPAPAASAKVAAGSNDPIKPLLVKTITYRIAPVRTASLGPMPPLVPVAVAAPQPQAAAPAVRPQPAAVEEPIEAPRPAAVVSPQPEPTPAAVPVSAKPEPAKVEIAKSDALPINYPATPAHAATPAPEPVQAHARGGWLIQIGAYEGEDEAKQHLSDARAKARTMLASADPFTERVQKGDKSLYRARFAGFDKDAAEAACRQLKHSDIQCITLKN